MARRGRATLTAAVLAAALLPAVAAAEMQQNAFARWGDLVVLGNAPHYLDLGIGVFDLRAPFDSSAPPPAELSCA